MATNILRLFLAFALVLGISAGVTQPKRSTKFTPEEVLKRVATWDIGAPLNKLMKSDVSLEKLFEYEWGVEDTYFLRAAWKALLGILWMDDILVPVAPINVPTFNASLKKTHLRGLHKLANIEDYLDIGEGKHELTFVLDNVELRTIGQLYPEKGAAVEARARVSVGNLKLRVMWMHIDEVPYPVIARVYLTEVPTFEPYVKLNFGGDSFQQPTSEQQAQLDKMMDYIQNVYFGQVIAQAFSQQNLDLINNGYKRLYNAVKSQGTSVQANGSPMEELEPIMFDGLWFITMTKTFFACDKYNFDEIREEIPFEHKVGLVTTRGTMQITGGEVSGADYFRRDLCFGPTCWIKQSEGVWAFKFDQFYATYNIKVKYLGFTYNGKIVITETGNSNVAYYESLCYGCQPRFYRRELLDAGEMIVDINGLPINLNFLQSEIKNIASGLRDTVVTTFAQNGIDQMFSRYGMECPNFVDEPATN